MCLCMFTMGTWKPRANKHGHWLRVTSRPRWPEWPEPAHRHLQQHRAEGAPAKDRAGKEKDLGAKGSDLSIPSDQRIYDDLWWFMTISCQLYIGNPWKSRIPHADGGGCCMAEQSRATVRNKWSSKDWSCGEPKHKWHKPCPVLT